MNTSVKVGSTILLFLILFVSVYIFLGEKLFAPETKTYYAKFKNAQGLNPGSKVMVAGVSLGEVHHIKFKSVDKVLVAFKVNSDVKLPEGCVATIESSLFGVGVANLQIIPPKALTGRYLAPGTMLSGKAVSAIDGVLPEASMVIRDIHLLLKKATHFIDNLDVNHQVDEMFGALKNASESFTKLGYTAHKIALENEGSIRKSFHEGAEILTHLAAFSEHIASFTKEKKLNRIAQNIDDTIIKAEALIDQLRKLSTDSKLIKPLEQTLNNSQTITAKGKTIANKIDKITDNGITLTEKINNVADKTSHLIDNADCLISNMNHTIDHLPFKKWNMSGIRASADASYELRHKRHHSNRPQFRRNHLRTDVKVAFPFKGKEVHIGIYDAFETNKLILQLAQPLRHDTMIRYGAYAGKPGFGVDYYPSSMFSLHGDLFGLNRTRFDTKAQINFGNGIMGWAGLQDAFRSNIPTIGVGIRK